MNLNFESSVPQGDVRYAIAILSIQKLSNMENYDNLSLQRLLPRSVTVALDGKC